MNNISKKLSFCLLGAFLIFNSTTAFAALEDINDYSAGQKLSRGVLNVVSSPVEIGRSIYVNSEAKGPAHGWTVGLVTGLGRTLVRAGAGLVEVVTFPFDFPDENKAPLIKPEYPWQQWSGDYVS